MQVLTELEEHRAHDCQGVTKLAHFTLHKLKEVSAAEQITEELSIAEQEVPRLCDAEEDPTELFEQMENSIPLMYQGTRPRKSVKRPPWEGDMFLMPRGKLTAESSDADHYVLWMGQIHKIHVDAVVVHWWSSKTFLGQYYPLQDLATVLFTHTSYACTDVS
jgi:hypothetical protein